MCTFAASKDVVDMGYSFSKPYALKIFDAQVQGCLAFGDHEAVGKMMMRDSRPAQDLLKVCPERDVVLVMKSKSEATILQAMQRHLKSKKRKMGEAAELIVVLSVYSKYANFANCLVHSMHPTLKKLLVIIDHGAASVTDLCDAVEFLEQLESAGKAGATASGQDKSVLLEFLLGAGKPFFDEAAAAATARQHELANQNELHKKQEQATELRQRAEHTQMDRGYLDLVGGFLDEARKIQTRRKTQNAWSKTQLKELQTCVDSVKQALGPAMKKDLADRLATSVEMCQEALANDGYVSLNEEQTSGQSLQGALTKETLVAGMMPETIYQHTIWPTVVEQVPLLGDMAMMVNMMIYVMCVLLSKTRAWTVLDQVEARIVNLQDISSIAPWLLKLGCARDIVEKSWSSLVDRCRAQAEEKGGEASKIMKHLIGECVSHKFGNIGKATTDPLFAMLPPKCALKAVLVQLFKVVGQYTNILSQGTFAKWDSLTECVASLKQFQSTVTAFGQENAGDQASVLDKQLDVLALQSFAGQVMEKLQSMLTTASGIKTKALKAAISRTLDLLNTIDLEDEAAFRLKMKQQGNKVAKRQQELKQALDDITETASSQASGTASGQDTTGRESGQEALETQGKKLEKRCMQFACVYVCMTLFNANKIGSRNENGAQLRLNLQKSLASLDSTTCQSIFPEQIAAMRDYLAEMEPTQGSSTKPPAKKRKTAM